MCTTPFSQFHFNIHFDHLIWIRHCHLGYVYVRRNRHEYKRKSRKVDRSSSIEILSKWKERKGSLEDLLEPWSRKEIIDVCVCRGKTLCRSLVQTNFSVFAQLTRSREENQVREERKVNCDWMLTFLHAYTHTHTYTTSTKGKRLQGRAGCGNDFFERKIVGIDHLSSIVI